MTTTLRIRCDTCERYASLGPGVEPEELGAAGWRVVREEAVCPACVAEDPAPRGPAIVLSERGRSPWLPPSDLRSPRHRAWIATLDRVR